MPVPHAMNDDKTLIKRAVLLLGSFVAMSLLTVMFWLAYSNSHSTATEPYAVSTVCGDIKAEGFTTQEQCISEAALIGLGPEHCVQKK